MPNQAFTFGTSGLASFGPLSVTATGSQGVVWDEEIANGTANVALPSLVANVSATGLQGIYVNVVGGNATLKTNNATAPTESFSLVANQPIMWARGGAGNCPVTANITAGAFVQNLSGGNITISAVWIFN